MPEVRALPSTGSRSRGAVPRLMLGSVTETVVHKVQCAVLVIRPQVSRRLSALLAGCEDRTCRPAMLSPPRLCPVSHAGADAAGLHVLLGTSSAAARPTQPTKGADCSTQLHSRPLTHAALPLLHPAHHLHTLSLSDPCGCRWLLATPCASRQWRHR